MPTWLVDGMNVVGARPDGWWRDRSAAMARLAARLDAFAAATGDEVHVVFDGRPRDLGLPADAAVGVAFAPAPGPGAADREIASRAGPAVRVVTSDAALAEAVRATGAQVEGAGAFLRRLDHAAG